MPKLRFLLAALGALLWGAPVLAQSNTGSFDNFLTIPFPPLSGVGIRDLQFGAVIPSSGPKTVLPDFSAGSTSGEWRIQGLKNRRSVDISFTLPTALTTPAGQTLAISFDGNYAGLCEIDDATQKCLEASFTTWNPVATPTFRDTPERWRKGRKVYQYDFYSIYIGGQAQPTATQPGGTYSGTIGITAIIN
jgi:hypothetical protein